MANVLNTLVHLVNILAYGFTLYYASFVLRIPFLENKFKDFDPGQFKYLTIWNVNDIFLCAGKHFVQLIGTKEFQCKSDHLDIKYNFDKSFPTFHKNKRVIKHTRSLSANSREMQQGLVIGFHVITFLQYAFAVYYDYMFTIMPHNVMKAHSAFGGKFKFLTFWDAILQTVFFLICVLNDCFGTNAVNPKKRPFVRKLKDYFHASLGFPIAMFVGIIFWILMFVDRELVLPKAIDPYFPWWLNHLMHTMIIVTTVLEMIVAPRQYPKRSRGLTILVSFMLMYLVWIHVIYFKSGFWVYPVMEVLTLPLRIVFIMSLLVVCIVLYFVGEALDNYLWGNKYNTKHQTSHAKSK